MGCSSVELLSKNFHESLQDHAKITRKYGRTLQKSMLLTPLLPNAGPTGGLGLAWPAPTMSLTNWSLASTFRAISDGSRLDGAVYW